VFTAWYFARIIILAPLSVRALANRDYLGDWFARTTHVGHSLLACTAPKALPGKASSIARFEGAVTLRAI
jgi:hypothetical protein